MCYIDIVSRRTVSFLAFHGLDDRLIEQRPEPEQLWTLETPPSEY